MSILLIFVDDEGVAVIKREGREMDRCSELGLLSVAFMCLPQAGAGDGRVCFKYPDGACTHMMMQVKYMQFCKPRLASRVGENL